MAGLYTPQSLGIKAPSGGFQQGGWYNGRQYWDGMLSDPGVINPKSNQQGAGQAVSKEVNAQSAAQQGVSAQQLETYLQQERDKQAKANVQPAATYNPNPGSPSMAAQAEGAGLGITPPATINLPDLYKNLSQEAGIAELEAGLKTKADAFQKAQSQINDNPWLSEATRVGRIAKLTTDYNQGIKNDQDALAMKKQDIATQLDIATKQFDINSASAKQALDQFNVLLQSGALAGASGNDIAAITKATGISSSMIQSAIGAQRDKDRQTSVTTVDDGSNVYSVVIDSKTGEIINKQAIGRSKPSTAQATESDKKSYYMNALRTDAQNGLTLSQIFNLYTGYLDPNLIYQLYNANSKYGPDKGDVKALEKYGVSSGKSSSTEDLLRILSGQ